MSAIKYALISLSFVFLNLVFVCPVFGAEQPPPHTHPYPWTSWHGMQWPAYWWIFPLLFFIVMCVLFIFFMKRGGMSCWWGHRMMDTPEIRDAIKRYMGEHSESALEILNKRYAKGEIDKQEYEEKKAAITG